MKKSIIFLGTFVLIFLLICGCSNSDSSGSASTEDVSDGSGSVSTEGVSDGLGSASTKGVSYGSGTASTQGGIEIGGQIWMTENLNVDRFKNGDLIPQALTRIDLRRANKNREPAWCYIGDDSGKGNKYGKLYNWYAVNDPRGLAPEGWHIPSKEEWTVLINHLGGETLAGEKLKSKSGWENNTNGNNQSGFSALPGLSWGYNMAASTAMSHGCWWSSTEVERTTLSDINNAWYLSLSSGNKSAILKPHWKENHYSVRCVKD